MSLRRDRGRIPSGGETKPNETVNAEEVRKTTKGNQTPNSKSTVSHKSGRPREQKRGGPCAWSPAGVTGCGDGRAAGSPARRSGPLPADPSPPLPVPREIVKRRLSVSWLWSRLSDQVSAGRRGSAAFCEVPTTPGQHVPS